MADPEPGDLADEVARRQAANAAIIEEFRSHDGLVGGPYEGKPLLLLHSVGARTGTPRINPMMYFDDGDRYVVIASNGGRDQDPGWFHNVVATPDVTIEVGDRTERVRATVAGADERRRLYDAQIARWAGFTAFEEGTDRVIPVVILAPRE